MKTHHTSKNSISDQRNININWMFVLMMFTRNDNQLIINNKSIILSGVGPNVKCLNGNFLSIYKNQFKVGKNLQLEINIMTDMNNLNKKKMLFISTNCVRLKLIGTPSIFLHVINE